VGSEVNVLSTVAIHSVHIQDVIHHKTTKKAGSEVNVVSTVGIHSVQNAILHNCTKKAEFEENVANTVVHHSVPIQDVIFINST
jgi:hypothetical protein